MSVFFTERINVKVLKGTRKRIQQAAKKAKVTGWKPETESSWIRSIIRNELKRVNV